MNQANWQAQAQRGVDLLQSNQPVEALELLKQASEHAPQDRGLRYWIANGYRMTGDVQNSESIFQELLDEKPGDLDTSFAFAFLLRDSGQPDRAAQVLTSASEQPGVNLDQLLHIAGFLRDSHLFEAAIQVCQRALELSPRRADLHFKLARMYQSLGDADSARKHLKQTLDLKPAIGPAWMMLTEQKRFDSADDPEFKWLEQNVEYNHGHEAGLCKAFAYGKALEDQQRWSEAWQQYVRGNELLSMTRLWNRDAWNRILHRTAEEAYEAQPNESDVDSRAIFIVGMPCSGGSLLEKLLDRQPGIFARGELNFLDTFVKRPDAVPLGTLPAAEKARIAGEFWKQLRLGGPEHGYYIDRNPLNFRYLDFLFGLMPSARVIHVNRDGRDSALSCFFQPFEHNDMAFSNNLDHLVKFYRGYRQLMSRWGLIYGERILQVNYDELVQSSDEVMARVMQFIGAPCDNDESDGAGAVRSEQARQPVREPTLEKWRHYHELAPVFFDRLKAIDARF